MHHGTATKVTFLSDSVVSVRAQALKMYFKIALYESTLQIMLSDSLAFV